jgi:hypothetical protein
MTIVLRIALALLALDELMVGAWNGGFVLPAGIAYTVFSIPHFVFHAAHLDHATSADVAFLIAGNAVAAALGVLVIVIAVLRMTRDRRALHDPAVG